MPLNLIFSPLTSMYPLMMLAISPPVTSSTTILYSDRLDFSLCKSERSCPGGYLNCGDDGFARPLASREHDRLGCQKNSVKGMKKRIVPLLAAARRTGHSRMNGLRKSSLVVLSTTWVLVLSTWGRASTSLAKLLSSSLFLNLQMIMLSSSPV